ncbi:GNAT family N-acetyltransferase [Aliikangiella coralliicola]|uniref:GNAT family N-acetyltransferase n=1 Tax=Aliikangiella coralliicola TaxID=2592383 RepID=A0A545U4K7_9GAMM|nr:N-acetyltransferase [Aliikangiella coralliicola]TQV84392.1 GNAT family N-acetyltransferase [Aliikangiella coralliicola]
MNSGDKVIIERVREDDAASLLTFARETFIEAFARYNSASDMESYLAEKFTLEQIRKELGTEGAEFYAAKIAERQVGYLKVNWEAAQSENLDDATLEIERIYCHSDFYGQGIAQILFNKALSLAKEGKVDYLWLGVWEENPRAIRFYEKCGFVPFGKHDFKLGESIQTDIMMRLLLK